MRERKKGIHQILENKLTHAHYHHAIGTRPYFNRPWIEASTLTASPYHFLQVTRAVAVSPKRNRLYYCDNIFLIPLITACFFLPCSVEHSTLYVSENYRLFDGWGERNIFNLVPIRYIMVRTILFVNCYVACMVNCSIKHAVKLEWAWSDLRPYGQAFVQKILIGGEQNLHFK